MSDEQMWRAAHHARESADKMQSAASSVDESARRIARLLEDGYGGRGLQLIELLEEARGGYEQALADVEARIKRMVERGEHSQAEASAGLNAVDELRRRVE